MRRFPEAIQNCVIAFSRLPGVGHKTALRYVFHLLQGSPDDIAQMAKMLEALAQNVRLCDTCFTYTQQTRCEICADASRDPALLCVVETARDIATLEATGTFKGRYHVLGGTLNPIEGVTPEVLRVRQLLDRAGGSSIHEIILAFSPDVHGEATTLYLQKQLAGFGKKLSRLARGLPVGASLEFADEVTLGDAMKERKTL